jgi:hypothetical protein
MRGKTDRPATRRNIKALVPRLAREDPEWGLPQDPRGTGRPGSQGRGVVLDLEANDTCNDMNISE